MSEPTNAPGQQPGAPEPTGPAAGPAPAPVPVQQATAPTPEPSPADPSWARYQGLQGVHQQTVADLQEAQTQLAQLQQHTGTMETQLQQVMGERQALQAAHETLNAQLAAARAEQQFYGMVTREFPQLVAVAPYIQRVPDEAQQREILQNMATALGQTAAQQAHQQIAQQLAGATPGTTPVAGSAPAGQPTYAEVMEHVMDDNLARSDPETWQRWYDIYQNHPEMNYESLGMGPFHDPFASHYASRARLVGQQPSSPGQGNTTQAIEPGTGLGDGVWAGPGGSSS